jgi:hypothetical protein
MWYGDKLPKAKGLNTMAAVAEMAAYITMSPAVEALPPLYLAQQHVATTNLDNCNATAAGARFVRAGECRLCLQQVCVRHKQRYELSGNATGLTPNGDLLADVL